MSTEDGGVSGPRRPASAAVVQIPTPADSAPGYRPYAEPWVIDRADVEIVRILLRKAAAKHVGNWALAEEALRHLADNCGPKCSTPECMSVAAIEGRCVSCDVRQIQCECGEEVERPGLCWRCSEAAESEIAADLRAASYPGF